MVSKDKFKNRHKVALDKLQIVAFKKQRKGMNTQIAAEVGSKLGISGQTVLNYLNGNPKDGFLTEAITEEFKKLQ